MDSNSAVSSSKEHGIGTADNEERREKNTRRMEGLGGGRGSALQACPLEAVVVDGGGGGGGMGGGGARLHSCFHIPGQVQEGSRLH